MSTIQEANSKVNDLKVDLGNVIKKQYDSTKATADFQDTTETMELNAKLFEKQTSDLESTARKRNWWMCSKQCILVFVIGIALIVGIIIIIIIATKD